MKLTVIAVTVAFVFLAIRITIEVSRAVIRVKNRNQIMPQDMNRRFVLEGFQKKLFLERLEKAEAAIELQTNSFSQHDVEFIRGMRDIYELAGESGKLKLSTKQMNYLKSLSGN